MTGHLVYSLETDKHANGSTHTYGVHVIWQPTRSAIEQRLTRPANLHHCLLAADGKTGAAAYYLVLSKIQRHYLRHSINDIIARDYCKCIYWRNIQTGRSRYLLVHGSKKRVNVPVDEGHRGDEYKTCLVSLSNVLLSCFSVVLFFFFCSSWSFSSVFFA